MNIRLRYLYQLINIAPGHAPFAPKELYWLTPRFPIISYLTKLSNLLGFGVEQIFQGKTPKDLGNQGFGGTTATPPTGERFGRQDLEHRRGGGHVPENPLEGLPKARASAVWAPASSFGDARGNEGKLAFMY